jgi:hypothetical protein
MLQQLLALNYLLQFGNLITNILKVTQTVGEDLNWPKIPEREWQPTQNQELGNQHPNYFYKCILFYIKDKK